jgi:NADH-quinone oxidoreductase subunit J
LIFYLFVLMLLDLSDEERRPRFGNHWLLAAAAGLCFATIAWLAHTATFVPARGSASNLSSLKDVGYALFGPFALPFEIAGLVLLAAIIGAVVLARRRVEG